MSKLKSLHDKCRPIVMFVFGLILTVQGLRYIKVSIKYFGILLLIVALYCYCTSVKSFITHKNK
ncbi:hypothetical protein [Clostridium tyrobutyricum]|jgi:uncharacterized protein YebE (UPF0316 family)|uniref:hypothetical protein n=1 Tax=Clostridium tyrobutyricum TaxID=1519 RepID=UPI00242CC099|nr:hypothetical protein [Clostridium tyrobutyricum]MCH4200634.1 hypothetical protein [Clostridium tyrobutyricum]MCH4237532.1 hypothetical protein [Clostridium tyrobutyricum]